MIRYGRRRPVDVAVLITNTIRFGKNSIENGQPELLYEALLARTLFLGMTRPPMKPLKRNPPAILQPLRQVLRNVYNREQPQRYLPSRHFAQNGPPRTLSLHNLDPAASTRRLATAKLYGEDRVLWDSG